MDPATPPKVPTGDYLILADGRMFRYVGQEPLPESLFSGGGSDRGEDADEAGLDTLNQGIVIGTDDRSVVTSDTTLRAWPHRTIGSVIYSATATSGGCTATMIGPRHAVTAAHCLHDGAGSGTGRCTSRQATRARAATARPTAPTARSSPATRAPTMWAGTTG